MSYYPPAPGGAGEGGPRIIKIVALAVVLAIMAAVSSIVLIAVSPLNFGGYISKAAVLVAGIIASLAIALVLYIIFAYIPSVLEGETTGA